MITIEIQRLRNLTTGKLHTNMKHVYEDVEQITGSHGVMTHMLPALVDAITPWLREKLLDERLFDGKYDPSHNGAVELSAMSEQEKVEMWGRVYKSAGKV